MYIYIYIYMYAHHVHFKTTRTHTHTHRFSEVDEQRLDFSLGYAEALETLLLAYPEWTRVGDLQIIADDDDAEARVLIRPLLDAGVLVVKEATTKKNKKK